jgi:hypothetical protein
MKEDQAEYLKKKTKEVKEETVEDSNNNCLESIVEDVDIAVNANSKEDSNKEIYGVNNSTDDAKGEAEKVKDDSPEKAENDTVAEVNRLDGLAEKSPKMKTQLKKWKTYRNMPLSLKILRRVKIRNVLMRLYKKRL